MQTHLFPEQTVCRELSHAAPKTELPPCFEVSCVCYQVSLESPQSPCLVSLRFLLGYLDGLGLMCLISKALKEPMFSAADFLRKPESILNNVKDLAFRHRKWSFLVNVLGPPTKASQFSGAGWETHHSLSLFSLPVDSPHRNAPNLLAVAALRPFLLSFPLAFALHILWAPITEHKNSRSR